MYDEDLTENLFFRSLRSEHGGLFRECGLRGWIVCVPRTGGPLNEPDERDLLAHVLVPDDELPDAHYFALDETPVRRGRGVLRVLGQDREIDLLFEETFYGDDGLRHRVWCVDGPLNRPFERRPARTLLTLGDCVRFLWTEGRGRAVLDRIDRLVADFDGRLRPIDALVGEAGALYSSCLSAALDDRALGREARRCRRFAADVRVAVEAYVHHGVHDRLFRAIGATQAARDAALNKTVRNLADVQLADLEVDARLDGCIPRAGALLSRLQNYGTALGKLACLRGAFEAIRRNGRPDAPVPADDAVPAMIFLAIKAGVPNWHAQLAFLKRFRFAAGADPPSDETSYVISTLEAVIEHIETKLSVEPPALYAPGREDRPPAGTLDALHRLIKLSDHEGVKEMLGRPSAPADDPEAAPAPDGRPSIEEILRDDDAEGPAELCHPLCSCARCSGVLTKRTSERSPTVSSRDRRGFAPLHVAAVHGEARIADLLLEMGADADAADHNGSTPLHHAAARGHQSVLLLLLHAGAGLADQNVDKNTALHLASNNGHETCVKALVYFSEYSRKSLNLSLENANGLTPLHSAAKWGYEGIVRLLLEYGADPWKKNSFGKNALDLAHNNIIEKVLYSSNVACLNSYVNVIAVDGNTAAVVDLGGKKSKFVLLDLEEDQNFAPLKSTKASKKNSQVKPQSIEEIKQIERLFRAIAYGDVKLACFYMNININKKTPSQNDETHCHPLCVCEKCSSSDPDRFDNKSFEFNIDTCDMHGNTALHTATKHGQSELCKILLEHKASPSCQNKFGSSPLHMAAHEGKVAISKILIEYGSNVDLKDSLGNTCLHSACISGNIEIVQIILENTTNINLMNLEGKTPLEEAKDRMFLTIMALFEDK